MLEVTFWSSVVFVAYAYVIYPVLLSLVSAIRERRVDRADVTPPVSFIIAAHNEQARIQGKIENTLRLEYPRDRLEIIVAVDEPRAYAVCRASRGQHVVKHSPEGQGLTVHALIVEPPPPGAGPP